MIGILPRLEVTEAIETAMLWAAGGRRRGLDTTPPFRSPHHTASKAALVGGGSGNPLLGEASLAHTSEPKCLTRAHLKVRGSKVYLRPTPGAKM